MGKQRPKQIKLESEENRMKELTLQTVIDMKLKGGTNRVVLADVYNKEMHGELEDFFGFIQAWIHTGRAVIVEPNKSQEEIMADAIAEELMSVNRGKSIEEDRAQRENYKQTSNGVYSKVGFVAKTLLDAQEMHQMLMKNFNIKQQQLGVEMKNGQVIVTITDCPVKTYVAIDRSLCFKRTTETVSGFVDKTAKNAVNITDITLNSVAVPVAKTAIATTTKVAKSLFGFGAKIGGIAIGEVVRSSKQCIDEIKNDGYIAEAKGEVIDATHSIRRTFSNRSNNSRGGFIID